MKLKNIIISFFTLLSIWLLLNNSVETVILISGLLIASILSMAFCRHCNVLSDIKFSPKAILYSFIYLFVFRVALAKSNLDVAKRVLSPKLPIRPGIVEVKTKLKSKIGRMVLANSITLTPGTFTVEICDDCLYIHWIDVKSENEEEDTSGLLQFNPDTDIEFNELNIKCRIDKVDQVKESLARALPKDVEFSVRTTTNANFTNCKPLIKKGLLGKEQTIDKKKRGFINKLNLVYVDEEKIDINNPALPLTQREIFLKTKLNVIDNKLGELQKSPNNVKDIEGYNSLKDVTLSELKNVQDQMVQSKREQLFLQK